MWEGEGRREKGEGRREKGEGRRGGWRVEGGRHFRFQFGWPRKVNSVRSRPSVSVCTKLGFRDRSGLIGLLAIAPVLGWMRVCGTFPDGGCM